MLITVYADARQSLTDKDGGFEKDKLDLVLSYVKALLFSCQIALSIGESLKMPTRACKTVPAYRSIGMQ